MPVTSPQVFELNPDLPAEADVIIVLRNDELGAHRLITFWDCDVPPAELWARAVQEACTFSGQCGTGHVDFHVIDTRAALED